VVAKPTSQKSAKLRSYFHQVQQRKLSPSLCDVGAGRIPFSAGIMLVRN